MFLEVGLSEDRERAREAESRRKPPALRPDHQARRRLRRVPRRPSWRAGTRDKKAARGQDPRHFVAGAYHKRRLVGRRALVVGASLENVSHNRPAYWDETVWTRVLRRVVLGRIPTDRFAPYGLRRCGCSASLSSSTARAARVVCFASASCSWASATAWARSCARSLARTRQSLPPHRADRSDSRAGLHPSWQPRDRRKLRRGRVPEPTTRARRRPTPRRWPRHSAPLTACSRLHARGGHSRGGAAPPEGSVGEKIGTALQRLMARWMRKKNQG